MRRFRIAVMTASFVFTLSNATFAQEKPGDKMIYKYLCAETDKLSKKFLDGAKTIDEWKKIRPRLHREYMYMLGLNPLPKKTPLKVKFTASFEHEGIVIDNLHFQSKPGLYVTANLYRPKGTHQKPKAGAKYKKHPAVVYVCGHSNRGRNGNKSAFQDHGVWFAKHGYICIILDTLQLGEIPGVHHGTYGVPYNHLARYGIKGKNKKENRWWWHAAGYTPAGVECWNGIRAIDYLVSRADVDANKIAVTGISGGGAATFWIAAADERVACAVPVSGMSDLESYVKNKVINGHCDCMFLYNTFQWEWTTIAALVAPRPMLFANSDNDRIFPMDGNRRIIKKLRKIYTMYGKAQLVDEYVSVGGHAYRPDLRKAVFRFINKHIKGDGGPAEDLAGYALVKGEKLRVFPTDADVPKDQINTRIDETFVPRAKVKLPNKSQFMEWRKRLLQKVEFIVFRTKFEKHKTIGKLGGILVQSFAGGEMTTYDSRHGMSFLTIRHIHRNPKKNFDEPTVIVLQAKSVYDVPKWMTNKQVGEFSTITRFCPFSEKEWTRKSPPNFVERSHVLLGASVDQNHARNVLMLLREYAEPSENPKRPIRVIGRGQAGILAAYAALFEPSIKEVVVIDPPTSHMQGPYFLNVLRVLDIPTALGLLVPRVKLTLINAKDKAFDRTAEIYRIAGAEQKFVRK